MTKTDVEIRFDRKELAHMQALEYGSIDQGNTWGAKLAAMRDVSGNGVHWVLRWDPEAPEYYAVRVTSAADLVDEDWLVLFDSGNWQWCAPSWRSYRDFVAEIGVPRTK